MPNIYNPNFNQNVVEVYTEEPGFTGFKGLDWTKLDSIEDILTGVGGTGPNTYLSGILDDTSSIDNKLFITGDPYPAGVQGTIVFQLYIQNLDTGVLYVKYGLNANASDFNFVLAKNTVTNAGDGGILNNENYVGDVSVSGLVTPRYISWERTNINKTPLV